MVSHVCVLLVVDLLIVSHACVHRWWTFVIVSHVYVNACVPQVVDLLVVSFDCVLQVVDLLIVSFDCVLQVVDLLIMSYDCVLQVVDFVMVCNGHLHEPNMPKLKGLNTFKGRVLHTHDYKDFRGFEGKRILVLGIGNSGADVACELSRHAKHVSDLAVFND